MYLDRYDLDGNGRITKAEATALLTHIPAALRVLHALADGDSTGLVLVSNGSTKEHANKSTG